MQKPWFRQQTGWWYCYVEIDGKRCQKKLAKGKDGEALAWEALSELEKGKKLVRTALTVAEAFDEFLDWSSRENKPETYRFYRHFLTDFARHDRRRYASLRVADLIPNHVTRWLAAKAWNPTTRNRAISCVKRALNHCVGEGLLLENPLRNVRKPRIRRRDKVLTAEERQAIEAAVPDEAFRTFLFALGQTGAAGGDPHRDRRRRAGRLLGNRGQDHRPHRRAAVHLPDARDGRADEGARHPPSRRPAVPQHPGRAVDPERRPHPLPQSAAATQARPQGMRLRLPP